MTNKPRELTEAEIRALRAAMKGAIHPVSVGRDHTPNALTAETLRNVDAGVDVRHAGSVDELFRDLGIQEKPKNEPKNA